MGSIFFSITVIICLATVIAIIFRFLKQPPILAYILSGITLGLLGIFSSEHKEVLQSLAEIGITLLLFTLGLELQLKGLKSVGKAAFIVGISQIFITCFLGFLAGVFLRFSLLTSMYIAIAITFSSTIIIVKLLSDKKDLQSLHGKITVGILLLQDFFAIFVLIILSGFANKQSEVSIVSLLFALDKAIVLFGAVLLVSNTVIPKLLHRLARSQEILFLFSLGWVFGIAAFVSSPLIGFPIEIGGFLAGVALANTSENIQIAAKVRGVRDFFITIFFVTLGMGMSFSHMETIVLPVIVLSFVVLLLKPLVTIVAAGLLGYRKRTSFLVGISLAQVSEFSLIILFLGQKVGHITNDVVSIITLIAIVSFIVSTYAMLYSNYFYKFFKPILKYFEQAEEKVRHGVGHEKLNTLNKHIALIGGHQMGRSILEVIKDGKDDIIVIDFDPDVVNELTRHGFVSLFGDISDLEIQEKAQLAKAKLIISTVPDLDDNLILVKTLAASNKKAKIIVVASEKEDARVLYRAGADYVVLPYVVGGKHLAKIIKEDRLDEIEKFKQKDFMYLV